MKTLRIPQVALELLSFHNELVPYRSVKSILNLDVQTCASTLLASAMEQTSDTSFTSGSSNVSVIV